MTPSLARERETTAKGIDWLEWADFESRPTTFPDNWSSVDTKEAKSLRPDIDRHPSSDVDLLRNLLVHNHTLSATKTAVTTAVPEVGFVSILDIISSFKAALDVFYTEVEELRASAKTLESHPKNRFVHLFDHAYARLESLSTLPQDWDSEGSAPPSATSTAKAANLLHFLIRDFEMERFTKSPECLSPVYVAPLSSGSLQLEWRNANKAIEVEIDSDGKMAYLADEATITVKDASYDDNVSLAEVIEAIRWVAS